MSDKELERLWRKLQPLAVDKMPLAEAPPRNRRFGSPLVLSELTMSSFVMKKHLSRRTFLNGVSVTLALPFLESMIPAVSTLAESAGAAPRTRLAGIYFPHGAILPRWVPAADGAGFELSEILQPLKPFYEQVNVFSGLSHALLRWVWNREPASSSSGSTPERSSSARYGPSRTASTSWRTS